jgi:hypothetical protein
VTLFDDNEIARGLGPPYGAVEIAQAGHCKFRCPINNYTGCLVSCQQANRRKEGRWEGCRSNCLRSWVRAPDKERTMSSSPSSLTALGP